MLVVGSRGGLPAPVEVRLTAREALDEPVVRLARAGLLLRLGQDLAPGMPVEVYVQTGTRTPLEYMVKPITDYFNRALREE